MKLTEQRWPVLVSSVRLGADQYRVVRPAREIRHGYLYESYHGAQMTVDKAAAVHVAMAWALAARSRNTVVYLPLRHAEPGHEWIGDERLLDLVLVQPSVALAPSRWKEVRGRLGRGAAQTVQLPGTAWDSVDFDAHPRPYDRDFRDDVRWSLAADTLFLTGGTGAFRRTIGEVRTLIEDGFGYIAGNPGEHCCAEISIGRQRSVPGDQRYPHADLHIEYCTQHA